jgi:hypothetical protein
VLKTDVMITATRSCRGQSFGDPGDRRYRRGRLVVAICAVEIRALLIRPVFPDVARLKEKLWGPEVLNPEFIAEAAVLRLVKAKDYEPELLYWDNGSLLTVLTGAAVDPKHGKLIAGGVVEHNFVICDIDV